jgi:hypothetical protein
MSVDLVKISQAIRGGLSAVCATCECYWNARARNVPGSRCSAVDGCGSPLRGDDFHEYVGPITDLARWCFVCGSDARFAVRAPGKRRKIGVCTDHVVVLSDLRPVDRADLEVKAELCTGSRDVLDRIPAPRKKTLAQAIYEVEHYYAKKNSQ